MSLSPLARRRIPVVGCFFLGGLIAFAACGGCRLRNGAGDTTAAAHASSTSSASASASSSAAFAAGLGPVDPKSLRDPLLWKHAMNSGDVEDLTTLATHEGAAGLIEAATSDQELRPTAIRAMGYARGWAQLPFLAKTASGKDDEEAKLALDGAIELSSRPRRSEDNEDAEELKEGCEALGVLAKDTGRPRPRRVAAIRALRMLPCNVKDIPTDLDAK